MRKPRTAAARALPPVRPSIGLAAAFRRKLDELITRMHEALLKAITKQYRSDPPAMLLAQDSPASEAADMLRGITHRWKSRFDKTAEELARYYATAIQDRSDARLRKILEDSGMTVRFKMTAEMRDVLAGVIHDNVSNIKKIAADHLAEVEEAVMRSVVAGRDLASLTREMRQRYGVTKKRAARFALHQNNAATAAMTRARQVNLGIEEAVWMHSHAGREPRPTHVANDGKKFDLRKGWYDPDPKVRKRILPGELINCRCTSRPIIPGIER